MVGTNCDITRFQRTTGGSYIYNVIKVVAGIPVPNTIVETHQALS